jgi:hypothetical protein
VVCNQIMGCLFRRASSGRLAVAFFLILILAVSARATPAEPADAPAEPADAPAAPAAATRDVGDLWRTIRHKDTVALDPGASAGKPFMVIAPSIGSKPSTGFSGGFSGNMAFFRGGDEEATHISSISGGFKLSQKKQLLIGAKLSMFTAGDRWFVQGDTRLQLTSQNTYGLGSETRPIVAENAAYTYERLYETVYRQVAHRLFVGGGLTYSNHLNIRPTAAALATWDQSAYIAYAEKHSFDPGAQTSAGTSAGVLFDTRDNSINAARGWFASASYRTYFDGFLGGDSSWQELYVDLRTYKKLTPSGRQKLAFWFQEDHVVHGAAPYLDLPATAANDRSARGYGEGRYRGEHLLYGEMEYRSTVTPGGLLGFVAFLNTTTVGSQETSERVFDAMAPGAGMGLRVLLNKRSRTNLCADYGWGKQGSRGFYLAIQEAF